MKICYECGCESWVKIGWVIYKKHRYHIGCLTQKLANYKKTQTLLKEIKEGI